MQEPHDAEYAEGTVVRVGPGTNVLVRLENGDEVLSRISRGHPMRVDIGQRVRIRFRPTRREESPLVVYWFRD